MNTVKRTRPALVKNNALKSGFSAKKNRGVRSIFRRAAKEIPELQLQSSVKSKGLLGKVKYLAFILEPHWSIIKSGSRKISEWSQKVLRILWHSKRGKLVLVQTGIILLLTSLLFWQLRPPLPSPKLIKAQSQDNTFFTYDNLGIRRYLPSARDYIDPEAFTIKPDNSSGIPVSIWLTPWNLNEQKKNLDQYSEISAFWLTVDQNGYDVQARGDWEPLIDTLKNLNSSTVRWLSVSGDPDYVFQALVTPDIENKLIENLHSHVEKYGFSGIDIDFEGLGEENRELFSIFIKHLTDRFHQSGKLVSVTVEVAIGLPPMNWAYLGQIADEIRPMFYDYHSKNTGFPGPIAPFGWVVEQFNYAKNNIPINKLVPALGNYGYDWIKVEASEDVAQYSGQAVSVEQAVSLAKEYNQEILRARGVDERGFDIGDTPHFTYVDSNNVEHQVWFEDQISLLSKIKYLADFHPKSIIFWNTSHSDTFQSTINTLEDLKTSHFFENVPAEVLEDTQNLPISN